MDGVHIAITDTEAETLNRAWDEAIEKARRRITPFGRGDTFDMPVIVQHLGITVLMDWTSGSGRLFSNVECRHYEPAKSWRFVFPFVKNPCGERPIIGMFSGDIDAFRNDLMALRMAQP